MSTAQHANDRTTTWQRPELRRVTAKATAYGQGPMPDVTQGSELAVD